MELEMEKQWGTLLWAAQKRIVATEDAIQNGKAVMPSDTKKLSEHSISLPVSFVIVS